MRKVFIENLPRKWERGREGIDWTNSIGYKVDFIYDNVKDTLEIIDYIKDNKHVVLKYKNNKLSIYVSSFKNAQLGKLLKKVTNEFKIEIGTKIKDDKRDITIIDRKYIAREIGLSDKSDSNLKTIGRILRVLMKLNLIEREEINGAKKESIVDKTYKVERIDASDEKYISISFEDITDKDNEKNFLDTLKITEIKFGS